MPELETPADIDLLARLRDADSAALELLYDRHAGYAMAVAYRIVRSREEAEEVVQDVFWKLWKASIAYDPERGRFPTWLFGICRNRAIDSLRRRSRRPNTESGQAAEDIGQPADREDLVLEKEQSRSIQSALSKLSDPQRRAIELSFFEGMTHREIAAETGEPLGTIKSRIYGGIEKLRESLPASGVTA